jgi:cAMP-dependent protein kinase regulator
LNQNEILFRAGDIGSLFYIILEGIVGINIKLPNPEDPTKFELKEVNHLPAGTSFGELALLNDNV